jgi:hypothetical protein
MLRAQRIAKLLTPVIGLALLVSTTPSAFASAEDTVTGSGSTGGTETFSFAATGVTGKFRAAGTMEYVIFGQSHTADVDCLHVEGNRATVEGRITASNVPERVGYRLAFYIEDNGVPGVGQDLFEEGIHKGGHTCHLLISGFALTAGEITIVDAP